MIIVATLCTTPSKPTNGEVQKYEAEDGALAIYSCHSGFRLDGIASRRCSSDGRWSGIPPTCQSTGEH